MSAKEVGPAVEVDAETRSEGGIWRRDAIDEGAVLIESSSARSGAAAFWSLTASLWMADSGSL